MSPPSFSLAALILPAQGAQRHAGAAVQSWDSLTMERMQWGRMLVSLLGLSSLLKPRWLLWSPCSHSAVPKLPWLCPLPVLPTCPSPVPPSCSGWQTQSLTPSLQGLGCSSLNLQVGISFEAGLSCYFQTTLTIRDAFIQGAENTLPFPNILRSEGVCFLCAQTSCLDSSLRSICQKLQDPCMENRLLESNAFSSASKTSPKRAVADIQAVVQFLSKGLWPALCLHSHTPSWDKPPEPSPARDSMGGEAVGMFEGFNITKQGHDFLI